MIEFGNTPPAVELQRMVILTVDKKRRDFGPEWFADFKLDHQYNVAQMDPLRPEDFPIPWWAVKSHLESEDIPFITSDLTMNHPFRFIGDLNPIRYLADILEMTKPDTQIVGTFLSLCKRKYHKKTAEFMFFPPIEGLKDRYSEYIDGVIEALTSYP